jgi:cytidylate kinase
MIVTIDGPAASGKGTVAKGLAARLGFAYLDTGAMYRAVALAAARAGVSCDDSAGIAGLLPTIHIEMPPDRVLLNTEDVTEAIRAPEVSQGASKVAAIAAVRAFLVPQQRRIGQGRDIVCEGRDQGTVVFPRAECKIYLTAAILRRHFEATGQITWKNEPGNRVGLKFVDLSEALNLQIKEWLWAKSISGESSQNAEFQDLSLEAGPAEHPAPQREKTTEPVALRWFEPVATTQPPDPIYTASPSVVPSDSVPIAPQAPATGATTTTPFGAYATLERPRPDYKAFRGIQRRGRHLCEDRV